MRDNFQACLKITLAYEGGYSVDRRDPGNWTGGKVGVGILKGTNRGISAKAYPKVDIKNLTLTQTGDIYRVDYWNKVNADRLAAGVDLVTFDSGVQSGPSRAWKWLMESAGGTDVQTVKKICAKRLGFFQTLNIWKTYKNGLVNRVASVEAKGVSWAAASTSSSAEVRKVLAKEATAASAVAKKQTAGAGTAGTATTATGGDMIINPQHADQIAGWVLGGMLAAGAVVAAILIIRAIIHKQRAKAYASEAEAVA